MRNDDEFYAYVLEKYRIKKQKGLSKKTMAASAAGNYQYEQPRPALNRKRAAAYVTAAVALIAGLGVCVYVFNPFQVIGPVSVPLRNLQIPLTRLYIIGLNICWILLQPPITARPLLWAIC